jgi:hypothetical protein
MKCTIALVLGLVSLVSVGCASFSESKLPRRSLDDLHETGKPCALTYQMSEGGLPIPGESQEQVNLVQAAGTSSYIRSRVEPLFRRAFVDSKRQTEPGEWHVDMYYRETHRNMMVSMTLFVFCIASFGVVPTYAQDDLYLEARLKHDKETVKQFVYNESVETWVELFLIPWAFSRDPIETKSIIVDNMILNLIHDLKQELPQAGPAH